MFAIATVDMLPRDDRIKFGRCERSEAISAKMGEVP